MALDSYYLLKMINAAGGVKGRKRLQKLVFLAKIEGCDLEDQFFLHYFGPYSSDLAARIDDLTDRELLWESQTTVAVRGVEFHYELTEQARQYLAHLDDRVPEDVRDTADKHATRFASRVNQSVWELELASTMLYWRDWGKDWNTAAAATARKKNADPQGDAFRSARELAEVVWTQHEKGQ